MYSGSEPFGRESMKIYAPLSRCFFEQGIALAKSVGLVDGVTVYKESYGEQRGIYKVVADMN